MGGDGVEGGWCGNKMGGVGCAHDGVRTKKTREGRRVSERRGTTSVDIGAGVGVWGGVGIGVGVGFEIGVWRLSFEVGPGVGAGFEAGVTAPFGSSRHRPFPQGPKQFAWTI